MNQHVPLTVVLVKVIKELRLSKRNEDAHRDNYRGFRKEGVEVKPSMQVLLYSFKIIMYVAAARSLYYVH
jgi:hypothetical protein